jgi:hypothetical protein
MMYGADVMARSPANTPDQKAAYEALAREEEAEDKEDEVDQIPANIAINRYKELTMDGYAPDSIAKTLQTLEDQLSGGDSLRKGLEALEDRVDAHHERDRRVDADHDQQLEKLWQVVKDLAARQVTTGTLSKFWDDLRAALVEEREERRPLTATEAADKALAKAVVPFLSENPTPAETLEKALWVMQAFGRRGGTACPYDREEAWKLTATKSITPDEHRRWKQYGRLPDHVTLDGSSQGRAQAAADRAMLAAHALASIGMSPLAAAHLMRRR